MKKYFLLISAALTAMIVACNPEPVDPDGNDPKDPDPEPDPVVVEKSSACELISVTVTYDGASIEGQLFKEEKRMELTYNPEQLPILKNGTATVVVSPKATVSPDPATIDDWSGSVDLTVTAEDGEHSATYEVYAQGRVYTVSLEKVVCAKTDVMGGAIEAHFGGNCHAFSGVSNIVDYEGNVFDLELKKVGTLNMTGISGSLASLANDDNGVLIATVAYGDEDCTTPPTPTTEDTSYASFIVTTKFFAWKNGWQNAPELIYTPNPQGNIAQFLNVSGDINKRLVANTYPYTREGNHHNWVFENGEISWASFATGVIDNRVSLCPNIVAAGGSYFYAGFLNGWSTSGQNLCSVAGDVDDVYVLTSAAPEWDGNKGGTWWRLGGSVVYAIKGLNGTEKVAMPGYLPKTTLISDELKHGGIMGYGNTDFVAAVKTFKFNGNTFAAIAHVGVQDEYFTVHNVDYYFGNSEQQYLQETIRGVADEYKSTNMKPSVAYVYNPAEDAGYIVVGYIRGLLSATDYGGYTVYKVTRKAIE